MTLRALAIFETAPPAEDVPPLFVNLLDAQSIAPPGVNLALLRGTDLIVSGSSDETALMEDVLGVVQLSHLDFMEEHVLKR